MHKQEDPNKKTIRFTAETDQKLHKLVEKTGLTKLAFFTAMVDYFYKSKKDPRDLSDELLKKELVKRSDTIIGFIRTQEEELLRPLKKDGERLIKSHTSLLNVFNEQMLPHAKRQEALNKEEVNILNTIWKHLSANQKTEIDTEKLKRRFAEILEEYIKAREHLGMMPKQAEKESLAENARMKLQMMR